MVLVRHTAHLSFDFFFFFYLTPCELDCTKDFILDHRPTIVFLVESVMKLSSLARISLFFFNNVVAAAFRMLGFSFFLIA